MFNRYKSSKILRKNVPIKPFLLFIKFAQAFKTNFKYSLAYYLLLVQNMTKKFLHFTRMKEKVWVIYVTSNVKKTNEYITQNGLTIK